MRKIIPLALTVLCFACDGRPSREKFPGGQGATTDVQQAQMEKAVMGGFDPLNNPISGRMAVADGEAQRKVKPQESIHGVIRLGRNVRLRERMMLYIAARNGEGGAPIAAKRLQRPEFPYEFTLSREDAIAMANAPFANRGANKGTNDVAGGAPASPGAPGAPGTPPNSAGGVAADKSGSKFQGELSLTVRLDQDGDPLTRQPGDYMGHAQVKVGDQNVTLVIDQESGS